MKKLLLTFLSLGLAACASNPTIGKVVWEANQRKVSDDVFLITPYFPNPASTPQDIYLSDLRGRILHTWKMRGPLHNSKFGPQGWIYGLRFTPYEKRMTFAGGECDELIAIDKNNVERLTIKAPGLTHDFDFVGDDKIATFRLDRLGPDKLKKFFQRTDKEFAYSDRISVMDYSGNETWTWHLFDHIKEIGHKTFIDDYASITNANSIKYIISNPITQKPAFLISLRNLDVVILVEYPSGKIIWQSPPNSFSRQHDAHLIGENVLLFNNNIYSETPTFEIVSINVFTKVKKVLWTPTSITPQTSVFAGGAQRLSNGSLLISNSMSGNLIEVNSAGEMVWSYLLAPNEDKRLRWLLGVGFYRAEVYTNNMYKEFLKGHYVGSNP